MVHRKIFLLLLILATVLPDTQAALENIRCCNCDTLDVDYKPNNVEPQVLPSPFRIIVSKTAYRAKDANEEINVNLTSTDPTRTFKQFILQAVTINSRGEVIDRTPLGNLTSLDRKIPTITTCSGLRAIKQADDSPKFNVPFSWIPGTTEGLIRFRASFVENEQNYWIRELSEPIVQIGGPSLDASLVRQNALPLIDPIHTDVCGRVKGCYRVPQHCWEPYCDYIATWRPYGAANTYLIEMSALVDGVTDRHVSLALSDDIRWGGDRVFECVHDGGAGVTQVYQARSVGRSTERYQYAQAGIRQSGTADNLRLGGNFVKNRVRCRFLVSPDIDIKDALPLSGDYHLLMSRGPAENGRTYPHKYGFGEYPVASPVKTSLSDPLVNIGGFARYPLVKAHGILMILAWCFFGTIGLLMTKYYKPMWPNKRFYGQRYWFIAHFNCMAWLFLLVLISVILIFVEVGGYSMVDYLPFEAHPILGLIIFCCVVINPIIALLRPPEDHSCRPCVNWIHWAFGTIAWCLAIPNMFIGMDFGKAHVPWWSTWILFIYILFHIIVEITLEVHQCCTHKKNKERRKKYDFQKRENPKANIPEPEPAGRIFKRNMLIAHFIVTCIVALIMLISIAAS